MRHHPADDIATEDIENHIELKVRPFLVAAELCDVPRPELIGRGGQQFWLGIGGMLALLTPVLGLAIGGQQSISRWPK